MMQEALKNAHYSKSLAYENRIRVEEQGEQIRRIDGDVDRVNQSLDITGSVINGLESFSTALWNSFGFGSGSNGSSNAKIHNQKEIERGKRDEIERKRVEEIEKKKEKEIWDNYYKKDDKNNNLFNSTTKQPSIPSNYKQSNPNSSYVYHVDLDEIDSMVMTMKLDTNEVNKNLKQQNERMEKISKNTTQAQNQVHTQHQLLKKE
jgi:hypothetical protein